MRKRGMTPFLMRKKKSVYKHETGTFCVLCYKSTDIINTDLKMTLHSQFSSRRGCTTTSASAVLTST